MKTTHLHIRTPRVIPLGCLIQNGHITHVGYLSKNKIIVPRWRYLSFLTNDLSPSKRMLRYLATLLIMVIRWPTSIPFTSKDRVCYQINGKTTMLKEKKMSNKDIWVGRLLLITCSISKKTSLLFSKQTPTLSKHLTKLENIFKRSNIFVYILTNKNHYKDCLNNGLFYKILSKKTHQAQFQTKSKWSSK